MKIEKDTVVKNSQNFFTKVLKVEGGFVYHTGWHLKREVAEAVDTTNNTVPMNVRHFTRAVTIVKGGSKQKVEETTDVETEDAVEETTESTEPEVEAEETKPTPKPKAKGKTKGK